MIRIRILILILIIIIDWRSSKKCAAKLLQKTEWFKLLNKKNKITKNLSRCGCVRVCASEAKTGGGGRCEETPPYCVCAELVGWSAYSSRGRRGRRA